MVKMTFKEINKIDVNEHKEQKMGLSYLSWAWAHQEMKLIDENATIKIHEFADPDVLISLAQNGVQITKEIIDSTKINYRKDKAGAYVTVSVTLNDKTETETLAVMDFKNKAVVNPDSTQINKAHKRCFVKALALHGLGLYIYAGEDLPEEDLTQNIQSGYNFLSKLGVDKETAEKEILKMSGKKSINALNDNDHLNLLRKLGKDERQEMEDKEKEKE